MSRIHFIGGEKGGVGKSVLARIIAQYHIDRELPFACFDADQSHGALLRYYAEYTAAIDLGNFESADTLAEAAAESNKHVIVDLPAQSATAVDQWMDETAVVSLCDELGIELFFWHVMDDGSDSVRLLERTLTKYGEGPRYVVVKNYGRGKDFSLFDESEASKNAGELAATVIDLPGLHAAAMRKIDRTGASLWAAVNNKDEAIGPTLGLLERQRVKVWLSKASEQLDKALT